MGNRGDEFKSKIECTTLIRIKKVNCMYLIYDTIPKEEQTFATLDRQIGYFKGDSEAKEEVF